MLRRDMAAEVTTETGSVYYVTGQHVSGGSLSLVNGRLESPLRLGLPMLIYTPERAHLFSNTVVPGVMSGRVIMIAPMKGERDV